MNDERKEITRREFLKKMSAVGASLAVAAAFPGRIFADDGALTEDSAGSDPDTNYIIDSLGRKVAIPEEISRVIPTGLIAQDLIITLCPEKLAALACPILDEDVEYYEKAGLGYLRELPTTGALYSMGIKTLDFDNINIENVDAVIDVGNLKSKINDDLNAIQDQTKTGTVCLESLIGDLPSTYRCLGELLNCSERAESLASFVEYVISLIEARREKVDHTQRILYVAGDPLDDETHEYIFQNEVIRFLGGEPVILPETGGNAKNLHDALIHENPDWIVFYDWDYYGKLFNGDAFLNEIWRDISIETNAGFAVAPGLFHSWIGFPVHAQIMGALWLGNLAWPEQYDFDLRDIARDFYELFYHYKMTLDDKNMIPPSSADAEAALQDGKGSSFPNLVKVKRISVCEIADKFAGEW